MRKSKLKYFGLFLLTLFTLAGLASGVMLIRQRLSLMSKAGSNVSLTFNPSSKNAVKNSNFSIDVVLNTAGKNIIGVDAIINFDPSKLTANGVTPGTIFSTYPGNSIVVDNVAGKIKVSGIAFNSQSGTLTNPYNGTGTFAVLNFNAKNVGTSQLSFVHTSGSTTDSNVVESGGSGDILDIVGTSTITTALPTLTPTPVPTATSTPTPTLTPTPRPTATLTPTPNPTFTITPTPRPTATSTPTPTLTPTPLPTATLTPTLTPTPIVIAGDVDGDGHVNSVDLGILLDAFGSTPPSDPRADLFEDGVINSVDLGIIIDDYGRY